MAVETELRYASSPRMAVETAALKACLRTAEVDTTALNDRIAELERQVQDLTEKLKNGVVAAPRKAAKAALVQNAAPAPQPQRPAVLTPTGKTDTDAWKEAMGQMKKAHPGEFSMLSMGRYVGCEDNLYRWEAPMGMDFFVGSLNKEEKRNAIAETLTIVTGVECRFEAVMPGQTRRVDNTEEAFLDELTATFGQENLMVQEDVK